MKNYTFATILTCLFTFSAQAGFMPFNEIPKPEVRIPEINLNLNFQNNVSIQSITKKITSIQYIVTGRNISEAKISAKDKKLRQKYQDFTKDLIWLKRNASKSYSPAHYPASLVEFQINRMLEKASQLEVEISEYEKINFKNHSEMAFAMQTSAFQILDTKHQFVDTLYQKMLVTMVSAKLHRKKLEPYFSI
jgi:hypothetical protein